MGKYVAQRVVKALGWAGIASGRAKVGILGLTFKEDVPDIRNTKVVDVARELEEFGAAVLVHDPLADPAETREEWGLRLAALEEIRDVDALILAVAHGAYRDLGTADLLGRVRAGGVVFDMKSMLDPREIPPGVRYLSL